MHPTTTLLSHGNGPLSHGNGLLSHGNGPWSHGNGPLSHGNGPWSHGNGWLSHGNGPWSHGNGRLSHGQNNALAFIFTHFRNLLHANYFMTIFRLKKAYGRFPHGAILYGKCSTSRSRTRPNINTCENITSVI